MISCIKNCCFDQTKVSWGIYRKLTLRMKEKLFYWGKTNNERNFMKKVQWWKKLAFVLKDLFFTSCLIINQLANWCKLKLSWHVSIHMIRALVKKKNKKKTSIIPVKCLFNVSKNDLFTSLMRYSVSTQSLCMIFCLKRK